MIWTTDCCCILESQCCCIKICKSRCLIVYKSASLKVNVGNVSFVGWFRAYTIFIQILISVVCSL